jgi:coatomer protein complex subunit gamma
VSGPSTLDTIGVPTLTKASSTPPPPSAAEKQSAYAVQIAGVPEFSSYGAILNSNAKLSQLTESETEYQVTCVKHLFKEHIVFQVEMLSQRIIPLLTCLVKFNVSNTLPDTVLEQVSVLMQPQNECKLTEDFIIPVPAITAATSPSIVYVSFTRESPDDHALASFQCTLKFVTKELDPGTGEPEEEGYEDEYQVEEIEVNASDYIVPSYAAFTSEWDRLRTGPNATETFSLSAMGSLQGKAMRILTLGLY